MDRIRPYLKRGETMSAPAGGLVQGLLAMVGFDPRLYAVFEIWDRETKNLVRGCEAVAIHGHSLCVRVPSVLHRQELLYSKQRILDRLNQALGAKIIKDIQFELQGNKGGFVSGQEIERNGRYGKNLG